MHPHHHPSTLYVACVTTLLALAGCASQEPAPDPGPSSPEPALALAQSKANFALCQLDGCPVHTIKRMVLVRRPTASARGAEQARNPAQGSSALKLAGSSDLYLLYEVTAAPDSPELISALRKINTELPQVSFAWLIPPAHARDTAKYVAATTAAGVPRLNVTSPVTDDYRVAAALDGKFTDGSAHDTAQATGPGSSPASTPIYLRAVPNSNLATPPAPQSSSSSSGRNGKPTHSSPNTRPSPDSRVPTNSAAAAATEQPANAQATQPSQSSTGTAAATSNRAQEALSKVIAFHSALDPSAADLYASDAEIITVQTTGGLERRTKLSGWQLRGALRSLYPSAKESGAPAPSFSDLTFASQSGTVTATAVRVAGATTADVSWTLGQRDGRWLIVREEAKLR